MNASSALRALVAMMAGALFWFLATTTGFSQPPQQLHERVDEKIVVIHEKLPPKLKNTKTEQIEKFVVQRTQTPSPKPTPTVSARVEQVKQVEKSKAEKVKIALDEQKKEAKAKVEQVKDEKFEEVKKKVVETKKKVEKKVKKKEEPKKSKKSESPRGVPVSGSTIVAVFGQTGPWSRYHTGIDFSASYGKTVRAVAPGKIVYAGNKGNWAGNHVVIRHKDGKKTMYSHLSSISKHSGSVEQGTKIGRVGQSGRAFGPHLHLELYPAGAQAGDVYSAINPRPWLRARGIRLG